MKLTPTQKLHALAYRFYQGAAWTPKAGDYFTSSRADLELYQVVAIEGGVVRTRYTEGSEAISEWPEGGFLTDGFGPRRVYVPEWVMNLRAKVHDHPDAIAVNRFADAMKAKLAQKRAEGRGGWEDKEQCTALSLSEMLHDHVRKGDPVDVGNFAMMLHQRGESIGPDPVFLALRDEAKGYAVKLLLSSPQTGEPVGLTFATLQRAHIERQKEWCPDQQPDLAFRGTELGGECGEALNVIKKLERERHGWRGSRDTVEHLAEELADVIHCTMLVALTAGIDLQKSVIDKFNSASAKNGHSTMLAAFPTPPAAMRSRKGEVA